MAEDETKSGTKAKAPPDAGHEDLSDDGPDAKSEARTETAPDTASEDVSESVPDSEGVPDAKPEAKTAAAPEAGNQAASDSAPDVKSETETDATSEVAPDGAPAAKPKTRPSPKTDASPEVVSDAKPKARPRPKSNRKVALVTGASGGIGEAFARKLAADGYALVLVARSDGELNRVAGLVTAEHDLPVATVPIDLTSPDAADEVEREFERRNITPEIVVNNAGFGLNGPVTDLGRERQIDMVDLNIRTLTDLSLRFIPAMRERGRGGIINVASTAAYMPGPFMAVYYASKAYVLSFSEALAAELKGTGITVTTVCPGPTATGFQAEAGMEKAALVKLFPMMSAEEVAELGYEGFRSGKRVVIPGVMNRIIAATTPIIPNRIILPLVRMLQGPRS